MEPTPASAMPQESIDQYMNLSSIVAVTVITLFLVAIVKNSLANVPILKDTPIGVFIVLIAVGLTIFANKVLLTLAGDNLWLLIWRSAVSALAASGLYKVPSWAATLKKASAIALVCLIPLAMLSGCASQAEVNATREGINAGTAKIREDHKEWAQAIAGVPGHHLRDLSQESQEVKAVWLNSKMTLHDEYQRWYDESKARSAGVRLGFFSWFLGSPGATTQPTAP